MTIENQQVQDIAERLIQAVSGNVSDENIRGVCIVFNSIKEMVDKNWEQYIANQTTEALAYDRIRCKCRRAIIVSRSRQDIYCSIV